MVDIAVSTRRARKCVRGLGRGILWTPKSSHTVRTGESCPASMWLTREPAQTSGINTNHPHPGAFIFGGRALPGMCPFLPLAQALCCWLQGSELRKALPFSLVLTRPHTVQGNKKMSGEQSSGWQAGSARPPAPPLASADFLTAENAPSFSYNNHLDLKPQDTKLGVGGWPNVEFSY